MVYKKNEVKLTNYLEIKKIEPTLTAEGVVASFRMVPAPTVVSQDACPFAKCAEVTYDNELGCLSFSGRIVHAVRLLVNILEAGEEEVVAVPDVTNAGFRVCRRATCVFEKENKKVYEIKAAGIASSVQWLMTAPKDSIFLITAKGRSADSEFNVLAYEDTKRIGASQYETLMNRHMSHTGDVAIEHLKEETPQKRLESLKAAVPEASTPDLFNKRRKLE